MKKLYRVLFSCLFLFASLAPDAEASGYFGGGVTANACPGGEFANAIASDGTLTCALPGGGGFPLLAPDGSAAAPSYSFASDPDTGIFRVSADTIGFSVGASAAEMSRSGSTFTLSFPSNLILNADETRFTYDNNGSPTTAKFFYDSSVFANRVSLSLRSTTGEAALLFGPNYGAGTPAIYSNGTWLYFTHGASSYTELKPDTMTFSDASGFTLKALGSRLTLDSGASGDIYSEENLSLNRALQFISVFSRPTCNSTNRGMVWFVRSGAGVADTFEVCRKDAVADAYAWQPAAYDNSNIVIGASVGTTPNYELDVRGGAGNSTMQLSNTASGTTSTDGVIFDFDGTNLLVDNQEDGGVAVNASYLDLNGPVAAGSVGYNVYADGTDVGYVALANTTGTVGISVEADGTFLLNVNGSGYPIRLQTTDAGVDLATSGTKPTCNSSTRGQLYNQEGGAGVADVLYMCMKAAADTYAWETVKAAP